MKYCQHVVMTTFQYQSTVMRRISLKPANSKFIVKENIYVYFESMPVMGIFKEDCMS